MMDLGVAPHELSSLLHAVMSENPKILKRTLEGLVENGTMSQGEIQRWAKLHVEHINSLALREILELDTGPSESTLTRLMN